MITNIGLDHTSFLGKTYELIAAEKAGIIKQNRPVVIGQMQKETTPVFCSIANGKNATLKFAEELIQLEVTDDTLEFSGEINVEFENPDVPFYAQNLRTALAAIKLVQHDSGIRVSVEEMIEGIKKLHVSTSFIGRWMNFE